MPENIGLALSGGGFRATLFHLGVIRELREKGQLQNVTQICSVSGGSITAAHLVLNWERYTGSQQEFDEVIGELEAFTRSDLRGFVVRHWLFSIVSAVKFLSWARWSRTKLCEFQYHKLFRGAQLSDLAREGRPKLHLLATSLTTGVLVAFSDYGVEIDGEDEQWHAKDSTPAESREQKPPASIRIAAPGAPVALGVASSSAFPPLFAPVRLSAKSLQLPNEDGLPCEHFLTDGGVYDNLGIRKLLRLYHNESGLDFDLVIASRAERDNPEQYDTAYQFIWQRASRSTDLMMQRISWFERTSIQALEHEADCCVLTCDLTESIQGGSSTQLSAEEELRVQTIRTDLDTFSQDEIDGLSAHAKAVLKSQWEREYGNDDGPAQEIAQVADRSRSRSLALEQSHKTRLNLWSPRDWASWATLALIVCYASPFVATWWVLRNQAVQAEQLAVDLIREESRLTRLRAERQRRTELLQSVEETIEGLAELIVSDSQEQFHVGLFEWEERLRNVQDSEDQIYPIYTEIFDDGYRQSLIRRLEEIRKGLVSDESNSRKDLGNAQVLRELRDSPFQGIVLEMVRKIRRWLLTHDESDEFGALLRSLRKRLYAEDHVVTSNILRWASGKGLVDAKLANRAKLNAPANVKVSRNRFRMLYWGMLCLVEGKNVEAAMVDFGRQLDAWEDLESYDLRDPKLQAILMRLNCAKTRLDIAIRSEDEIWPVSPREQEGAPIPKGSEQAWTQECDQL